MIKFTQPVRRYAALVTSLLFLAFAVVAAGAEQTAKTIRVLTIGNSFADNAATYMAQIADAAGYKLVLYRANIGASSLEHHWQLVTLHESDPNDPKGKPFLNPATGKREFGLKEALKSAPWDYVSIQQYSMLSADLSTYEPYAKDLYGFVKQHAPGAEVLVYETWAYRSDDQMFTKGDQTPETMYRSLAANYRTVAKELGCRIVPVGDAFHLASTDPSFQFVPDKAFNMATAVYPKLPDQTHSLNVGWHWVKSAKTGQYALQFDGHHSSDAGKYLAGLVWVERLTHKSVVGNSFVPPGMDADTARLLQGFAHQAVVAIDAEPR